MARRHSRLAGRGTEGESPSVVPHRIFRAALGLVFAGWLGCGLSIGRAADSTTLAEVLRRADELDARQEIAAALKLLEEADAKHPNQAEILIRLAKQQSNQIFIAKADAE